MCLALVGVDQTSLVFALSSVSQLLHNSQGESTHVMMLLGCPAVELQAAAGTSLSTVWRQSCCDDQLHFMRSRPSSFGLANRGLNSFALNNNNILENLGRSRVSSCVSMSSELMEQLRL